MMYIYIGGTFLLSVLLATIGYSKNNIYIL